MIPVILSGGSGSRLWPLSRKQFPKQFLALTGEHTLFQQTLERLVFEGMDTRSWSATRTTASSSTSSWPRQTGNPAHPCRMRWVSNLRLANCSLTMKRWFLLQTTIGVSMPSNTRRSRVCWNSVCSPVRARNCLGNCLRESGQRREPLPPERPPESCCYSLKIVWVRATAFCRFTLVLIPCPD